MKRKRENQLLQEIKMEHHEINKALDVLSRVAEEAFAHAVINERAGEAHKYCQDYLMPKAWGQNIWHAILDDAIRMRKELEANNGKATKPSS